MTLKMQSTVWKVWTDFWSELGHKGSKVDWLVTKWQPRAMGGISGLISDPTQVNGPENPPLKKTERKLSSKYLQVLGFSLKLILNGSMAKMARYWVMKWVSPTKSKVSQQKRNDLGYFYKILNPPTKEKWKLAQFFFTKLWVLLSIPLYSNIPDENMHVH